MIHWKTLTITLAIALASYVIIDWASKACWTPKYRCISSHYVSATCINYMTDTNGNPTGFYTYECGSNHCDKYEDTPNPDWVQNPKCNKPE